MLVVLTGIPGSGKTTLAKRALEILKEEEGKSQYEILNYGDIAFEIAKERDNVQNRDEIRKLKLSEQKEIQRLAAKRIANASKDKSVIIDTHCTISTPKGYIPGLPEWVLRELQPDLMIIIEASPEEIVKRRKKDETRERDDEIKSEIKLHQELNRFIAMSYSTLTGAAVKIIKNPEDKIDETARKLAEILKLN